MCINYFSEISFRPSYNRGGDRDSHRSDDRDSYRGGDRDSYRGGDRDSHRGGDRDSYRGKRSSYTDEHRERGSDGKRERIFAYQLISFSISSGRSSHGGDYHRQENTGMKT